MHDGAVDLRKGFDSLSGVVEQEFHQQPLSGDVFVFLNRTRNRIKLLHWQGDGFAIFYKRLERGTYELPDGKKEDGALVITHLQLQFILDGVVLSSVKKRVRFEKKMIENF